ncbi:MAG TPA: hypothetical protein VNM92_14025 [Thermoanaerobaculia bacterium]|nr:hypothetical protein [Thermoanaerobaculia bacterium]
MARPFSQLIVVEPRSGVSLSPAGRGKRAERSRERGVKVSRVRRKGEVVVSLAAPLPVAYATTLSPPGRGIRRFAAARTHDFITSPPAFPAILPLRMTLWRVRRGAQQRALTAV